MKAMSKNQIAEYLKNYALINTLGLSQPSTNYKEILESHIKTDNIDEYYSRMIKTYQAYIYFKSFSILEDYALNQDNLINNDDLKEIRQGSSIIDMPSNISDKRIIQLVRNAFNHNDSTDIERFKISEDVNEFEVYFSDVRTPKEIKAGVPPKPVNFKFSYGYLFKLVLTIQDFCKNRFMSTYDIDPSFDITSSNLYEELDKVKIVIEHLEGKQPDEAVDMMRTVLKSSYSSLDEAREYKTKLSQYLNSNATKSTYELTEEQKKKIVELRDMYQDTYNINLYNEDIKKLLLEVIPVPNYKQSIISTQMIISSLEESTNMSLNKLIDLIYRSYIKDPLPDKASKEDKAIYNELTKREDNSGLLLDTYLKLLNEDTNGLFPIIMYLDYVITNIYDEELITINGITYEKDKIRNSFAHLRWFITSNQELMMYDASPRNKDVYNLEEVGKIPIDEFFFVIENYLEEKSKEKHK